MVKSKNVLGQLLGDFERTSTGPFQSPAYAQSSNGECGRQRAAGRGARRARDRWSDHARAGRGEVASRHDPDLV